MKRHSIPLVRLSSSVGPQTSSFFSSLSAPLNLVALSDCMIYGSMVRVNLPAILLIAIIAEFVDSGATSFGFTTLAVRQVKSARLRPMVTVIGPKKSIPQ